MGRQSRLRSDRKLFNGQSAMDVHAEALHKKCSAGCGLDATTTIRSFAPLNDLLRKNMGFLRNLHRTTNGQIPIVNYPGSDGRPEKWVRVGLTFVCQVCRPEAEKAASRGPSWVRVEIDSVESEVPIIQVK